MREAYIRKPSDKQKELLETCPVWEHEPQTWEAVYDNRVETCLIIEGSGYITLKDGAMFRFRVGDLVTFMTNFSCTWTVEETIRKYYIFDMDESIV